MSILIGKQINASPIALGCMRMTRLDIAEAEKLLLTTWAYMIFYPKFSMERFAVYAEVNILLDEMLAGGWFE